VHNLDSIEQLVRVLGQPDVPPRAAMPSHRSERP
jgi:hypothetical protein